MENGLTSFDMTPADWHRRPGVSVVFDDGYDDLEVGRIEAVVGNRVYVKVPRTSPREVWPKRRMIWAHEIREVVPWTL
jgi:hypothetical protein